MFPRNALPFPPCLFLFRRLLFDPGAGERGLDVVAFPAEAELARGDGSFEVPIALVNSSYVLWIA